MRDAPADVAVRVTLQAAVTSGGAFAVTLRPLGTRPIQILHHGAANRPGRCAVAALEPHGTEGDGE